MTAVKNFTVRVGHLCAAAATFHSQYHGPAADMILPGDFMNLMLNRPPSDWDPRSEAVLSDQTKAYDGMRRRCPVAHSDYSGWSLFRHEDVVRVLNDHDTFSNVVSSHLSVPNGMDPPEHTRYRQMIESYFASDRMEAFEPFCRAISTELVSSLQRGAETEIVTQFAQLFALRIQCAFLGWPQDL